MKITIEIKNFPKDKTVHSKYMYIIEQILDQLEPNMNVKRQYLLTDFIRYSFINLYELSKSDKWNFEDGRETEDVDKVIQDLFHGIQYDYMEEFSVEDKNRKKNYVNCYLHLKELLKNAGEGAFKYLVRNYCKSTYQYLLEEKGELK